MSNDQKNFEEKAMDIYCQLADIENLIVAVNFAAQHEDERLDEPRVVSWQSILSRIQKDVAVARGIAEALEYELRESMGTTEAIQA